MKMDQPVILWFGCLAVVNKLEKMLAFHYFVWKFWYFAILVERLTNKVAGCLYCPTCQTVQPPMSPRESQPNLTIQQPWFIIPSLSKFFFDTFALNTILQQMHESCAKFGSMCSGKILFRCFAFSFSSLKTNRIFFETFALFALLGSGQCRGKT